jgi:hypothetical protein
MDTGDGSSVPNDKQSDSANGSSINTTMLSSDSESKVYKYKNKIQQRFSALPAQEPKGEGGHRYMVEMDKEEGKLLAQSVADLSDLCSNKNPSSLGSNYESSVKSNGSNDSGSAMRNHNGTDLSNTVPAFALHPMGVHYIPLVLPVSQVMPFMRNHKSMGICHPVSIPVSFTGPFLMGEPEIDDISTTDSPLDTHSKNSPYDRQLIADRTAKVNTKPLE